MIGRKLTATLGALAFVAIPATPSQAFCHLFGRCAKPTTTFYAPVAPVVAAPVCAQPQIVNYMPQTAYRAVIVNRPVVSYMPQTACDPCGRATTVMRPVTSFVAQQQLVPYTTFRPVVMPVAQPCCGAAPVTVSYAPAPVAAPACCGATPTPTLSSYSPAPVAAPAPACCGSTPTPSLSSYSPAPTTTTIIQPSTVTAMPAPPAGTPGSTLQSLQPTPDPSLNNGSYQPSTPQQSQTFAPNGSATGNGANGTNNGNNTNGTNGTNGGAAVEPQSRVLLPPYNNNGPSNPTSSSLNDRPRGLDPDDSDRTTAIPLRGGMVVRQASLIVPLKAEAKPVPTQPLDDSGWRAAGE